MSIKAIKSFTLKLLLALLMLVCVQAVACDTPAEAANDIKIIINGKTITSDVQPMIINSRTMVPVRVVSEQLGAQVTWNGADRSVSISKGSTTMRLVADQYSYVLNGASKTLDTPVKIVSGRTMVPLRVIGESLGAKVNWKDNTVYIYDIIIQVNQFESADAYLNLRQGPGTNYNIVGKVTSGMYLAVIGESGNWYKIQTKNGDDAYVSKDYVTVYTGTGQKASNILNVASHDTSTEGQASIAFNIGSGTASVVSNNGPNLVLQVDDVTLEDGIEVLQPAEGMPPFNGFKVTKQGDTAIRITANVGQNGFFRVNTNDSTLTITAVAKHKNGMTGLAGKVIVVSAGHGVYSNGTVDYGASSKFEDIPLNEVDFNTPVALMLRDKLEAAGAYVIMIRSSKDPINMTLYERAQVANKANADAFIEIHGDSYSNESAHGIGTWAYTDEARLSPAAQKSMREEFAGVMNAALSDTTGQPASVKYSNFAVIRETEIPCVLVECGFLSNREDAERLASAEYQELLAQGMFNGLRNYFAY